MEVKLQAIEGYAYGAIQPSMLLRFPAEATAASEPGDGFRALLSHLSKIGDQARFDVDGFELDPESGPVLLLTLIDALNRYCGDQRFTPIKVFEEEGSVVYALPTLSPQLTKFNLASAQKLLKKTKGNITEDAAIKFSDQQKIHCRCFLPSGTNAANFIAAAAERKIPFKIFTNRYIIFGYGNGSSIFNSSITDQESAIGVSLANSKVDTNKLLKISGFPVAEQARVRTVEDALHFAEKFGYPIVLKPESEEKGRGVYANIRDKEELGQCFASTKTLTDQIILERHVRGHVYRINTINGRVTRVVLRTPPKVTGDGKSTIEQLIHQANLETQRLDISSSYEKIRIDDDLHRVLKHQDIQLMHVPEPGREVVLSSGLVGSGLSVDCISEIHPDNVQLAEEVAKVLRLSITGIDFISHDISVPWHRNGGVICEVNSQPQLGTLHKHIYSDILAAALPFGTQVTVKVRVSAKTGEVTTNAFNACKSNVEVDISVTDLLNNGCPTQYFDTLEIAENLSEDQRDKLDRMLVSVTPELPK